MVMVGFVMLMVAKGPRVCDANTGGCLSGV